MDHLGVEVAAPGPVDARGQEQPGDQEEVRHAEGPRPLDESMQGGLGADGLLHPQRRMHHDDQNDADAFGDIHPIQPAVLEIWSHAAAPQ